MRRTTFSLVLIQLLLSSNFFANAAEPPPADLVLIQRGTLPIILTAPHGGREAVPGVPPRNVKGKPHPHYNIGRDTDTDVLVQNIARDIRALTGKDVYMVMARFERRYIDANRSPDVAYDSSASAIYYKHYHETIRRFVDEVRKSYSNGLLIDVHGQHKFQDHLVRGTLNGRAVSRLIGRAGFPAVTGPKGLYGQLEVNGFAVFPGNDIPPAGKSEDEGYNGGYTVALYGSHRKNGIDAVQFEFGVKHRRKDEIEEWSKRAARAIVAFRDGYLQ